jgi:SAM-dependent methyltransferase
MFDNENIQSIDDVGQDWADAQARGGKGYPWGAQWGGERLLDDVCELIRPYVNGRRVLEIGCGGGKWTKALFDRCGADQVCAIDVHQISLTESAAYEPRATYFLGNGDSIPKEVGAGYDMVFSYDVFLHLPPGLVVKYLQDAHPLADYAFYQLPSLDKEKGQERFLLRVRSHRYRKPYSIGYVNFYTDDHARRLAHLAGWTPALIGGNPRDSFWLCYKEQSNV